MQNVSLTDDLSSRKTPSESYVFAEIALNPEKDQQTHISGRFDRALHPAHLRIERTITDKVMIDSAIFYAATRTYR